ncbi:MAG TPA: hypothetical protein EYQ83_02755 [Acidobacteria bacterium]|nr:hypothetical protein [Acidobacteriota bacterium]
MLRSLTATAPVIAALMIVVLLFEPPALRPSERIPTLRVLTGLTGSHLALTSSEIESALTLGRQGQPPTYPLTQVGGRSGRRPAGVVYTPFLRVAWASYASAAAGRPLRANEVPGWMRAAVVYVAMRRPVDTGASAPLFLSAVPANTPTCCRQPQPTLARPLWVTDDVTALTRFGAPVPFDDLAVIAAYPPTILHPETDIVAFRRVHEGSGEKSLEMRGRLDPDVAADWR